MMRCFEPTGPVHHPPIGRHVRRLLIPLLLVTLSGCRAEHEQANDPAATRDAALREAREHFTYRGKPVHPGVVQMFHNWISDHSRSIVVGVDVAAAYGTNQFHQPVDVDGDWITHRPRQDSSSGEWFRYRRAGTVGGDIHVLVTAHWAGGSLVATNLLFVRFDRELGTDGQGRSYDRLVLRPQREVALGDRFGGTVDVADDTW